MLPILQTIAEIVGWTLFGVLLTYGVVRLFDIISPINYRKQIQEGNLAAGLVIAAIIVSVTAIVVVTLVT